MHTEPINHDSAVTFMQTGRADSGLPCVGSWCSYGLARRTAICPRFIFMMSGTFDQPITTRYFSSGFLPSQHQARSSSRPAIRCSISPTRKACPREARGDIVGGINEAEPLAPPQIGDPDIEARIHSYELAFRMQTAVPELMSIQTESQRTLDLYGPDVHNPAPSPAIAC